MTNQQQADLRQCSGCGITLQTKESDRAGYIPDQALQRDPVICQRCFRIKNYNDAANNTVHQDEFLKVLSHIADTNSLVLHIVDIFDFEGSLIASLQRFVGNNPVVLVVNKIDLLPSVTNRNKLVNWVQKHAKEQGIQVVDVVLCSAKKNEGFDRVVDSLARYRRGRDIYVVGATNVGKSTLINRFIRDLSDLDAELTTSQYPGTTLDVVKIPLDDGKSIIDTPGIVYPHRLTEIVTKNVLPAIMPDKPIKPTVFQLNAGQTLFIGALARFDFIQGERQSFTCFISNAIKVHRTKLENAAELYEAHKGEMLSPPSKQELESFPKLVKHPIKIPKGTHKDVMISGLGWIKINSDAGAILEVYAPKGIKVSIRSSLI